MISSPTLPFFSILTKDPLGFSISNHFSGVEYSPDLFHGAQISRHLKKSGMNICVYHLKAVTVACL
jgi:hypothetical protein